MSAELARVFSQADFADAEVVRRVQKEVMNAIRRELDEQEKRKKRVEEDLVEKTKILKGIDGYTCVHVPCVCLHRQRHIDAT